MEQTTNPTFCCPDCGTELQIIVYRQDIEPFKTFRHFHCTGKCHMEACKEKGIDPAQVPNGTIKFSIPVDIDLDNFVKSYPDIREALARETAIKEAIKIYSNSFADDVDLRLAGGIYQRAKERYSLPLALGAVYLAGKVQGIRNERKRRHDARERNT